MVGSDAWRKSTALAAGLAISCLFGGSQIDSCSAEPSYQAEPLPQPTALPPDFLPEIQPPDVAREYFFGARPGGLDEYRLGPEDVIEIRAFELDPLNLAVRVAGDGSIEVPLIGKLEVQGLTAPEAARKLMDKLSKDIENPQISVLIKEFNSRRVYVIGAVIKADHYPMPGARTLLQMLAEAGGLDPKSGKVLYVFRNVPDGRNARLTVPLHDLQVKGDPRYNIWLLPGDIVNVPDREVVKVSVLGAVKSPGIYELPIQDGPSLLKAIAMAGGLTPVASQKGLSLVRRDSAGRETITKIDMKRILEGKASDVPLAEGDVLLVKESFW
jgi:polysaccharide biosynthesis/export protein